MSNSVLTTDDVVFESIEHLNKFCNVEVKLPDSIPYDCNLICYRVSYNNIDFFTLYKETDEGLFSLFKSGWEYSSKSLQSEIDFDKGCLASKYIYVKVNRKQKDKEVDLFTPDCLVGVETDRGYVTSVLSFSFGSTEYLKPSLFVYTTESLSKEDLIDVHTLKYYISDESDETVSFTEYVEMFYDGWYCEHNECKEYGK